MTGSRGYGGCLADAHRRVRALSLCRKERIIGHMDWKQTIERWRSLTRQEQARIRLVSLPRKVARSMAFEGEPVDQRILERELDRLGPQPVT